jgi:hypothetical protein
MVYLLSGIAYVGDVKRSIYKVVDWLYLYVMNRINRGMVTFDKYMTSIFMELVSA